MAIIPAGFGQINYLFTGSGFPTGAEITFGFENVSAHSINAIAGDAGGIFNTNLLPILPTNVATNSVLVKLGPNATGPMVQLAMAGVGGRSAGDVNPQTAMLVQKRTALGGRMNRGRVYFPVGESDLANGGAVASGLLTAAAPAFATFFADMATNDIPLVILHTAVGLAPEPVTSLLVQTQSATQRRRNRR